MFLIHVLFCHLFSSPDESFWFNPSTINRCCNLTLCRVLPLLYCSCYPSGPRAGKRKRDGDVLEVMRQLEEEQMEALRQDYEQRERHFQLLLQHIKEEVTVRQEEAARARRQQGEFQQGVLTLLTQLVHVLAGRNVPSSSSPPLD